MGTWKFLKITIVYLEVNYFHFYPFARTIDEWPLNLIVLPSYITVQWKMIESIFLFHVKGSFHS